jgi:hypothetical protein
MPGLTGINWTATAAAGESTTEQGLIAYLKSIGLVGGRPTGALGVQGPVANIYTMVKALTDLFVNVDVTSTLENMMNSVTPDILQICKGTFSIATGACTVEATVLAWIVANRPDINASYAAILKVVVATYINTNLMPTTITAPSYLTSPAVIAGASPDPIDAVNVYAKGVNNLLHEVAKYLRHYGKQTTESWTTSATSASHGSNVAPLPETLY